MRSSLTVTHIAIDAHAHTHARVVAPLVFAPDAFALIIARRVVGLVTSSLIALSDEPGPIVSRCLHGYNDTSLLIPVWGLGNEPCLPRHRDITTSHHPPLNPGFYSWT